MVVAQIISSVDGAIGYVDADTGHAQLAVGIRTFFTTAGTEDFNYLEMRHLDRALALAGELLCLGGLAADGVEADRRLRQARARRHGERVGVAEAERSVAVAAPLRMSSSVLSSVFSSPSRKRAHPARL